MKREQISESVVIVNLKRHFGQRQGQLARMFGYLNASVLLFFVFVILLRA